MQIDYTQALFFGPPGMGELLLLAAVGLLIFGKRLPEVGRSMGKGIVEFKKGLSGIEDDINTAGATQPTTQQRADHQNEPPASVDVSTPPQPLDDSTGSKTPH